MTILHVIPSYYPAFKYGGPIQSVHALNKALVKRGLKVNVFTTNAGLEDRKDIPLNKWVEWDGVKVKYFKYYGYEHYNFSPQMFLGLLRSAKRYDMFHITGVWNFPVLAGSLVGWLCKRPYIISTRGVLYEEAINLKSRNKKLIYYSLIAQYCIKKASAIHFTTAHEREKVTSFLRLKNKVFIVPNGIDLFEFQPFPYKGSFKERYPILKGKRYILFLSRIDVKKGLDILVKAFRELVRLYEDLFLVIVGPDNEGNGEQVKNWLRDYELQDRTLFTGMLTGEDKISAYVDAEVFVLPSYSESLGMAIVEAMTCRTPVVISNKVGIYNEVKENDAGIVVETNPDSVAKGIKFLLDNGSLKNRLSHNAERLVEMCYDIEKVADRMMQVYEEVILNTNLHELHTN